MEAKQIRTKEDFEKLSTWDIYSRIGGLIYDIATTTAGEHSGFELSDYDNERVARFRFELESAEQVFAERMEMLGVPWK